MPVCYQRLERENMKNKSAPSIMKFLFWAISCACVAWGASLLSSCSEPTAVTVVVDGPAPELSLVDLATGRSSKLTDLQGKIVVIEFWASWCGPCQEAMAHFQTCKEEHSDWDDDVVLLSISIDDTEDAAREHLEKKKWNKTENAWVRSQGGDDPAVRAYVGKGIPFGCIVDRDGTVVAAGHPNRLDVAATVQRILDKGQ